MITSNRFPLIVLVGPCGVGKTYFTRWCMENYPREYTIARSVTTRVQRDAADAQSYEFLSNAEFDAAVHERRVLETGMVRGFRYGLDLGYLRGAMHRSRTPIISLTADSLEIIQAIAADVYRLMRVVHCVPASLEVLMHNLRKRFAGDETRVRQEFELTRDQGPPVTVHHVLSLTGISTDLPALHEEMRAGLGLPPL